MPLTVQEQFHLEEYKALREEITARLAARLQVNSWGLLALGAVYSYIFSNPDKPILFFVPVVCSLLVVAFLASEHVMVLRAATYIEEHLEKRLAAAQSGWETVRSASGRGWVVLWWPIPIWLAICFGTIAIAICAYVRPSAWAGHSMAINLRDYLV